MDLGHAKEIDLFNIDKPLECCYFLSHHSIMKNGKIRVVFDGSLKTPDLKLSLNSILNTGPVVQRDLFDILILFRTYNYVAMTYIKAMFR